MKKHFLRISLIALVVGCAGGGADADSKAAMDTGNHPYRTTKPSKAELKKELTPMQFEVTQEEGTEPPFHNAYFENHAAGIYVDITTGQPLFSSLDKYDSGTGWPSFTRPISPDAIAKRTDADGDRQEVRSKVGDAHLGHVFDDGPAPTGLRYCMNSASLRFIPADQLDGVYAQFKPLFATKSSK